MASLKQRGSRVVYVAGSARELHAEVQEWLSQADNRAVASPSIYDALALLAMGRKPTALIVSVNEVDWNEMEFFDHAVRLSPETRIYVTGHDHHHDKLEEACRRGAHRFDSYMVTTYLNGNGFRTDGYLTEWCLPDHATKSTIPFNIGEEIDALATYQRLAVVSNTPDTHDEEQPDAPLTDETVPAATSKVDPETASPPNEPQPTETDQLSQHDLNELDPTQHRGRDLLAGSFRTVSPWSNEPHDNEPLQQTTSLEPDTPATSSHLPAETSASPTPQDNTRERNEPLPVRLATAEDDERKETPAVAFPWSPSPNRPKRKPPSQTLSQSQQEPASNPHPKPGDPSAKTRPNPVTLTPEELAALMGDPPPPNASSPREGYR